MSHPNETFCGRGLVPTLGTGIRMRSHSPASRHCQALALAAIGPIFCACSDASGPIESAVATTGEIRVSVSTTGADVPSSYFVDIGARATSVPAGGESTIGGLAPGDYFVTLRVATNCRVAGDNPRAVRVAAGTATAVAFSVTCIAATGSLRVTTTTTGVDFDPDGYQLTVEGLALNGQRYLENWPLATSGTQILSRLPTGEDGVTLHGLAVNCDPADASQRTVTLSPPDTAVLAFTIVCSPDTGQLAFVVGAAPGIRHIYVINANRSNARRLTDNAFSDEDPAWSPDGRQIAFTTDRDANREIYVVNADGSNPLRLTNNGTADYQPAWSPDGTRIAFVSERAGAPGIFVMSADGTNQVRLTSTAAREVDPAWTPDGRIAFASERDGTPTDVYVMNADGSGVTRLTTGGGAHPAWSPNGTMLAYSTLYCGSYDCYPSIFIATQSATVLVGPERLGPADQPTWSPDGRKIAYSSLACDFYYIECNPSDVRIARIDGSDLTLLAAGWSPAWRPR